MTAIREFAFSFCSSLKSIYSAAEIIDNIVIDEYAFYEDNLGECTLLVPSGTRWAYKHHNGFGQFKNIEINKKKSN